MIKFSTRQGVIAAFVIALLSVQFLVLTARNDRAKLNYWGRPTVGLVSATPASAPGAATLFQVTYVGRDGQRVTRPVNMDAEFGNQKTTRVWLSRSGEVFFDRTGYAKPYRPRLFGMVILISLLLIVAVLEWWAFRVGFVPYQEPAGGFVSPRGITSVWAGF